MLLRYNVEPNANRKGDLLILGLGVKDKGWPLLLDVTITHPVCLSAATATKRDPTSSIRKAESHKNIIYFELAATNDIISFTPMALECYGALSKDCDKLVRKLYHIRAEALA